MKTTRLVALPLAALLCALPAACQKRAKITRGKDTTRILGPIRPDGTIDYLAAINQLAGKGVTKENNAAVGMLEAMGPEIIAGEVRDRALKVLDVTLPADGAYFTRYQPAGQAQRDACKQALENPWAAKDHPAIVKWLDANRQPLDTLVTASKRRRFYIPLLVGSDRPVMLTVPAPNLGRLLGAAKALAIRANLAIGQGRIDDAWRDILAMHRIGALVGQDTMLMVRLVGIRIGELADKATVNLATSGNLSGAKAGTILADLRSVGPGPGVLPAVDKGERFLVLGVIQELYVDPVELREVQGGIELPGPGRTKRDERIARARYKGVDFNDILRRANAFFDLQLAAMRKPTYPERLKARKALKAGLAKTKALAKNPPADKPVAKESAKTRQAGTRLLAMLLVQLDRSQDVVERVKVRHHIARLAVALAAFRADKGEYPTTLGDLAPKYVKTIPKDFFSGKALIYKRQGKGYLLYSVGENTRDDGGVWDRPERDDFAAKAVR